MPSIASRARPDRPSADSSVDDRVRYIAELMSDGEYHAYATRAELAKAWGVGDGAIRKYAAEASRLVGLDPEERDRLRVSLGNFCKRVREDASTAISKVTGLPDYASTLKAAELEGRFMGITLDDKRVELTGKGGGPVALTLEDVDGALGAADKNDDAGNNNGSDAGDTGGP